MSFIENQKPQRCQKAEAVDVGPEADVLQTGGAGKAGRDLKHRSKRRKVIFSLPTLVRVGILCLINN